MTVLENVLIGYQSCISYGRLDAVFHTRKKRQAEQKARERAMEILRDIEMDGYAKDRCMNLPYGVQKQLEIARAMVSGPKLLLLDEPAAGLNPQETDQLATFIQRLPGKGYGILLIEHDMSLVMNISDYIYVMDYGKRLRRGFRERYRKIPRLLMLDEPSLGLSPLLTEKIFELILEIRNQGTTILLVEQNAVSALSVANRGYVLKVGHITGSGTGKELLDAFSAQGFLRRRSSGHAYEVLPGDTDRYLQDHE